LEAQCTSVHQLFLLSDEETGKLKFTKIAEGKLEKKKC